MVTVDGSEQKEELAKFLGRLERKDRATPITANKLFVVRRWVLERIDPEDDM